MSSLILGWEQDEAASVGFTSTPPSTAGGRLIEDHGTHLIAIAGTGQGKGRSVAIPNLLHYDGPAIVLDVKGELAATTARYRRDVLGQEVIVLDPWSRTRFKAGSFNPLDVIGAGLQMADDCYQLAGMLSPPSSGSRVNEPFWDERGEALLAGLIGHALTDSEEKNRSLTRVYEYLNGNDPVFKMALDCDKLEATMLPFAFQQVTSFLSTPDITRGGILSTALSHIRVMAGGLVQAATATTSFDLEKIVRGDPVTVYIVVPPANLVSHSSLLRLWISAFLSLIFRRKAAPAKPTLLLLDEVAQLGRMEQVKTAVTLTRSYGVRVAMFLQSYSQLVGMFPREHATIFENCDTIVTMGLPRRATAAAMSEALGDVSSEALAGLRSNEAAVKTTGEPTQIVRRLDYLDDPMFAGRADRNPMYANRRMADGNSQGR